MNRIFLDFEMTPIDRNYIEQRKLCKREIIEIGAVVIDENDTEIGFFKTYVKTQYTFHISQSCTVLTGINNMVVHNAPNLKDAYMNFLEWCTSFGEYTIYAWSNSDFQQLKQELLMKEISSDDRTQYLFTHWFDFQQEFGELMSSEHPLALEDALNGIGIVFAGEKHDALWDARNTFQLYVESRDEVNIKILKQAIINAKQPVRDLSYSIGDLFDFNELKIMVSA